MIVIRTFVHIMIGLSLSFSVGAEIYQWVDNDGKVHFSDQAPQAHSTETKTFDTPLIGDGSAPDYGIDLNKPKQPELPVRLQSLPKPDPDLCKRAQDSLPVLQASDRLRGKAADGSVKFLTPEEITKQVDLAQQTIRIHCR